MKAYGIKSKDWGCCFGHDKYLTHVFVNRIASEKIRRRNRPAKKSARQALKRETMITEMEDE